MNNLARSLITLVVAISFLIAPKRLLLLLLLWSHLRICYFLISHLSLWLTDSSKLKKIVQYIWPIFHGQICRNTSNNWRFSNGRGASLNCLISSDLVSISTQRPDEQVNWFSVQPAQIETSYSTLNLFQLYLINIWISIKMIACQGEGSGACMRAPITIHL